MTRVRSIVPQHATTTMRRSGCTCTSLSHTLQPVSARGGKREERLRRKPTDKTRDKNGRNKIRLLYPTRLTVKNRKILTRFYPAFVVETRHFGRLQQVCREMNFITAVVPVAARKCYKKYYFVT